MKQTKTESILLKISQSIIGTLDYEKVLQIISDGMSELLDNETAAIYLLENEAELFLGATTPPLDPGTPEKIRRAFLINHPHISKTIKNRRPYVIPDTQTAKLSAAEKIVVKIRNLRSLLFLPFIQKDKVLGVLILGTSNKSKTYKREEIELGQTVANQLSIGIQNAKLHHDLKIKSQSLEEEIKERKQIEQALRNSEAHLSNALRIAKAGHWEYDIEKDLFTFTDEFYEIFHTSAEKAGGYTMKAEEYANQFVHPDHIQIVDEEIQKAIAVQEDNFQNEVEHQIKYKDKGTGYIAVRYKVIIDSNNKAIRILGVNQDITQKKLDEKELKNHRDNLEKLVKEQTFELDNIVKELRKANDKLFKKNTIIHNKNEELNSTLKNLKEMQTKLIQSEKMASLGVLTAGVAHEINNPLNYIMGSYTALDSYFKEHNQDDDKYITKLLEYLKSGLLKATSIVKGLNQFSRDDQKTDEYCSVHGILDNCLAMLNNKIVHKIQTLKLYSENELITKGNSGQLHQAFLNILTNAVQSIDKSGTITIVTKPMNSHIRIEITDTGKGIDEKILPKITDPFFTTKDPGQGTGLGLSISYSIIKKHSGMLEFESKKGIGTTVKIKLPMI